MAARADAVGAVALAARVGAREYPRLVLLYVPAFILELAVGFAIEAYARWAGLPEDVADLSTGESMQLLGVALPLVLLLYSVRFALWTFVALRVLRAAGVGAAASWRAVVAPALLMGSVLTLTFSVGLLLAIVGALVFLHWFAYAPAQLAAGASGVGAAFDRSRRFAREQRTYGYTALLVLAGLAVLVPYFLADAMEGASGIVVPALVAWVGGPLVPLLAASYVALVAREGSGAVETRAQAVTRAGATCPRCGALLTDARPGERVACASCGYAGKLL